MSDTDNDSKTEQATDKRRSEAMEKGQFAKSQELQVVGMLAAALAVFGATIAAGARDVASVSMLIWSEMGSAKLEVATVPQQLTQLIGLCAKVLGPVIATTVVTTIVVGGLQTGFRVSPKAVGFKIEALNFLNGFKRIFSKSSAVRAGVDFLKLIAIGLILWMAAKNLLSDPIFTAPVEVGYLGSFLRRATLEFLSKLMLALGVIAAISYAYERFRATKDMMMTKEEVKEEHKQAEGDARMKGAMRRMARRLVQKQMLAAVPTADVVVTNPTHFAVALKYERGKDGAPMVLAKGENRFALRIKALAAEHGVPVVENKPVARMLFAVSKVGSPIPGELYQAVAEILAFVYRTHRLYFHELKIRRAAAEGAATRRAG